MEPLVKLYRLFLVVIAVVTVVSVALFAVPRPADAQTSSNALQTALTLLGACQVQADLQRQQMLTWEAVKAQIEAVNPQLIFDLQTKAVSRRETSQLPDPGHDRK